MNDAFAEVLAEAGQVMVGITTRNGPHVTPELFTVSAGRIWCLTAASTLKARHLAEGGRVAVAARGRDATALTVASAVVLDPAHPTRTTAGLDVAARAAGAVTRFVADNVVELSGAVADFFAGRLGGPIPPHRVVLCIEPEASAVVFDNGKAEADGWTPSHDNGASPLTAPSVDARDGDGAGDDLVAELPDHLRALTDSGAAFLGWHTGAGDPLVLPVAWDATNRSATVPAGLLDVTGAATTGRAAVTRDDWTGYGPSGKQGVMLRGAATVDGAHVALHVDGVTYWDGVETATARR